MPLVEYSKGYLKKYAGEAAFVSGCITLRCELLLHRCARRRAGRADRREGEDRGIPQLRLLQMGSRPAFRLNPFNPHAGRLVHWRCSGD